MYVFILSFSGVEGEKIRVFWEVFLPDSSDPSSRENFGKIAQEGCQSRTFQNPKKKEMMEICSKCMSININIGLAWGLL